jgi:hypothetical protein
MFKVQPFRIESVKQKSEAENDPSFDFRKELHRTWEDDPAQEVDLIW